MNLQKLQPREALNKAFLKINPFRNDVENFKNHLQNLLDKITESESEEFHKNLIVDFRARCSVNGISINPLFSFGLSSQQWYNFWACLKTF